MLEIILRRIAMRKLISCVLVIALGFGLVGCGKFQEVDDEVQEIEVDYEEAKQKIDESIKEIEAKWAIVEKYQSLYYGETKEAKESEGGIQDLVYRNRDAYSDKEWERLVKAGEKVDKLVKKLKEVEVKYKELKKDYKDGTERVDNFFKKYKEAKQSAEDFNESLDNADDIVLRALQLGTVVASKNSISS